jgi:hypothetical protein
MAGGETGPSMNRVIFGDCRETMRDLKAQGVPSND